jgi:putative membrane protein
MYLPALLASLHHVAAFTLVATLAVEVATFKPPLSVLQARRLQRIDLIFGIAAALISIYPTITYLSWNPALNGGRGPDVSQACTKRVRLCLMLELTAILIILPCAALMARGFGYLG